MIRPFVRHDSKILLQTPIFDLRADDASHPGTGRRHTYYVLQVAPYVNVVALTSDGLIVLVRQWRHGTRDIGLEIPAGLAEPGESPEQAAARELREETGYEAGRLTLLGQVQPNPAHQDNVSYTVLAEGCHQTQTPALDDGEDIEVELVHPDAIPDLVRSGQIRSAMVICALFWWLDARGGLDWRAISPPRS
jgi:8-oxo-dGTP pyrophosphatase MutT (NUDIX family)